MNDQPSSLVAASSLPCCARNDAEADLVTASTRRPTSDLGSRCSIRQAAGAWGVRLFELLHTAFAASVCHLVRLSISAVRLVTPASGR